MTLAHAMPTTARRVVLVGYLLACPACTYYDDALLAQAPTPAEDAGDASVEAPVDESDADVHADTAIAERESEVSDGQTREADAHEAEASSSDAKDATSEDSALAEDRVVPAPLDASDCGVEATTCGSCDGGPCPTCTDRVMNGNETGIDCGGSCPANTCGIGSSCTLHTTCESGYCRSQLCAEDKAVSFFGDQAMSFRRPVTDDFTIEFWIKTTQFARGSYWWEGGYLFQADVNVSSNDYGSSVLNGRFAFGTGNPDITISSTSAVNTGVWTHVAATRVRGSGLISVFVNGRLENSATTGNTSSLDALSTAYIGSDRLSALGYVGDIDEVRAWSVARSAAEITGTMAKRLTGTEANLVGYWRLDEASGSRFIDASRSRNDGWWANATEPSRSRSGVPMTPSP